MLGTWKAAHASLEKLHFWTEMHRAVCRQQFTHRALSFVVAHYKYIISSVFSYPTHTYTHINFWQIKQLVLVMKLEELCLLWQHI